MQLKDYDETITMECRALMLTLFPAFQIDLHTHKHTPCGKPKAQENTDINNTRIYEYPTQERQKLKYSS